MTFFIVGQFLPNILFLSQDPTQITMSHLAGMTPSLLGVLLSVTASQNALVFYFKILQAFKKVSVCVCMSV